MCRRRPSRRPVLDEIELGARSEVGRGTASRKVSAVSVNFGRMRNGRITWTRSQGSGVSFY